MGKRSKLGHGVVQGLGSLVQCRISFKQYMVKINDSRVGRTLWVLL